MNKVWAVGLLSMCVACQAESPAHVTLDLAEWQARSALTQAGSITLRVSAPDMRALTFVVPVSSDGSSAQLDVDVPSGPARAFEITATGADGQVMYWGRQVVDLPSAAALSLTLPAFVAGVLQGTLQVASGAALPNGVTLNAQAVAPRPGAPASVTLTVEGGRLSQPLPTGDYVISGKVTVDGVAYAIHQTVSIQAGQTTQVQLVIGSLPGVAKMVFTTQPMSGAVGAAQPVVVQLRNAQDQVITGGSAAVTLQLISAGQPLSQSQGLQGSTTVQTQNGVATFGDLRATLAGSFTLRASTPGLPPADSNAFTLTAGPAAGFALAANATVTAGVLTSVPVSALDAFGNLVPSYAGTVSVTIANQTGLQPVVLAGGTGLINLRLTAAGPQSLILSAGSLTSTVTLQVAPGSVTALDFVTQPADSNVCTPFAQPVQLALEDAYGNVANNAISPVTLALDSSTPGALRGHTQVAPRNGSVTFADVTLSQEGNFVLRASLGTASASSQVVHITMVPPVVRDVASVGTAGMIQVNYTVADACARSVTMLAHWTGGGQPPIDTVSPINSQQSGTQGLTQLRTSPSGVAHTFLWESWQDVGRRNLDGVQLQLVASAGAVQSDPAVLDNLTLSNALNVSSLEATPGLRSPLSSALQLATVDLDHNGTQDVVSLANNKLVYGLMPATGSTVTQAGPFNAGTGLQTFAVADVNHDGLQDVVVGGTSGAALLRGLTPVSLGAPQPLGGGKGVVALALGDFDRDGWVDLATTDGTSSVQTQRYTGTGYATANPLGITFVQIVQLAAVDLDLDGDLDLVALDINHTVNLEQNDGQGNFTHGSFTADGNLVAMAVADINGDGLPDIMTGTDSGAVFYAQNGGSLDFSNQSSVDSSVQGAIAQMVAGDFDLDGLQDVAVLSAAGQISFVSWVYSQPSFANFTHPMTGVVALAAADVNRDAKADLLVSDGTQVGALRNLQATIPGLPPYTRFAAVGSPPNDDMALGELDGDGRTDAVVCAHDGVLVLVGDGDGQYAQRQLLPVATAYSPTLTDVDGDGILDLLLATRVPAAVTLRHGQGDGTFAGPQPLALAASATLVKMLGADMNGDLLGDLVVLDSLNHVEFFVSVQGVLQARPPVSVGAPALDVALGDFNGDGLLDVTTVSSHGTGDGGLTLLLASADGSYTGTSFDGTANNDHLAIGDIDGDGLPEGVVTNHSQSPNVYVWSDPNLAYSRTWSSSDTADAVQLGNLTYSGEGLDALVNDATSFAAFDQLYAGNTNPFPKSTNTLPLSTRSLRLADINGDPQLDVVAASNTDQALVTWQASEGGALYNEANTVFQGDGQATLVSLVDVDRNGTHDAVALDAHTDNLWLYVNNGGDNFNTPSNTNLGSGPVDFALGDLDRDGSPDALVGNAGDQTLSYLLGQGAAGFTPQAPLPVPSTPVALALGDLNHDGWLDIVMAGTSPNALVIGLSQPGNFTFVSTSLAAAPSAVALGDMTNDGTLDVVVATANPDVRVLPGLGNGTFGSAAIVGLVPAAVSHLALGDLNRDGQLDVAVAHPSAAAVSLLTRQGGGFVAATAPVGPQPHRVAVADVNGDGALDVVTACADQSVPIVLGDGNGGVLATPRMYVPGAAPSGVAVGSLNQDTRADIVVSQPLGPQLTTFLSGYRMPPLL